MASLASGVIVLWSGSIATIPAGFVLCDGSNGSPDLRDKFLVGAGSTYAVDAQGGAVNHNHTFTSDGHDHMLESGEGLEAGLIKQEYTTIDVDSGSTDNADGRPPYYALCWIMKT